MHVHQPPPARPELLVKAPAKRQHLRTSVRLDREQAILLRHALIDPLQYLLRLPDHTFWSDEHRDGLSAARAPRRDPVYALHVSLLAVGQPAALERPARLLAVVADRDRDQAQRAGVAARAAGDPVGMRHRAHVVGSVTVTLLASIANVPLLAR